MPTVDGSLGNVTAVEGERWSTEWYSALLLKIPMALPKYPYRGAYLGARSTRRPLSAASKNLVSSCGGRYGLA
jgi:hypothetical protein